MPMIYLACPYMHPDIEVREARVREADMCAAALMRDGHIVFSPLSQNHRLKDHFGLHEASHEFWMSQDLPWMAACQQLVVLCIDGWKESRGVALEIQWATHQLRIPVVYLSPRTDNVASRHPHTPHNVYKDSGEPPEEGVQPGPTDGIIKLH